MNKNQGTSYFYSRAELLFKLNRQNEAINLIEELGQKSGNRYGSLFEASRYFYWRGLPDYGLIFINLAFEGHGNDGECYKLNDKKN